MLGGRLRARRLSPRDRPAALECLRAAPEHNLLVIDQVERLTEIGADVREGWVLDGVSTSARGIEVRLTRADRRATFELQHASAGGVASRSFALRVTHDPGGARGAIDELFARVIANDRGGYWVAP